MIARKLTLGALLVLMCLLSTSCMGRFALSGKVREFNLRVTDHRWGREALFVGLYIIPVYPVAGAIDILIVNSVEFWNRENPLTGETPALVDVDMDEE